MKAYQMLIPAVLCLLAVLLVRAEASTDDELRRLNDKLFEITRELESKLEAKQMTDPDLFVEANNKRGSRSWEPFGGHNALLLGKRAGAVSQTDRSKKTRKPWDPFRGHAALYMGKRAKPRSRSGISSFFENSGLAFGKRAEYLPDDLTALQGMANDPYDEPPAKKSPLHDFSQNSAMLFGKRNAVDAQE